MVDGKARMRALVLGLSLGLAAAPACALEWATSGLPTFARGSAILDDAYATSAFSGAGLGLAGPGVSMTTFRISKDLLLGVSQTNGSSLFSSGVTGLSDFDISSTSLKLGFDLGRVTPFVTTSLSSAKASPLPGALTGFNTTGDLMSGRDTKTGVSAGAGLNFAITDSLQFGVSATAGTGRVGPTGW